MHLGHDVIQLLVSILIGGIIGFEREYHSKSAGLRTMILVTLGSCLFTILSIRIGGAGNPDRIAANIITGIGFLGAGVIFREDNKITGITTAVTVWMCAALGMAVGSDYYVASAIGTASVMVALIILLYLQKWIVKVNSYRTYHINTIYTDEVFKKYESLFTSYTLKSVRVEQTKRGDNISITWIVKGSAKCHEQCGNALLNDKTIQELSF